MRAAGGDFCSFVTGSPWSVVPVLLHSSRTLPKVQLSQEEGLHSTEMSESRDDMGSMATALNDTVLHV